MAISKPGTELTLPLGLDVFSINDSPFGLRPNNRIVIDPLTGEQFIIMAVLTTTLVFGDEIPNNIIRCSDYCHDRAFERIFWNMKFNSLVHNNLKQINQRSIRILVYLFFGIMNYPRTLINILLSYSFIQIILFCFYQISTSIGRCSSEKMNALPTDLLFILYPAGKVSVENTEMLRIKNELTNEGDDSHEKEVKGQ
jgi:hypothetical protein